MAENWALEFNGGGDGDEALRIAIAMSLGQDPDKGLEKANAIDLTQEDDKSEETVPSVPSDSQEAPSLKKSEDAGPAPPATSASSFSLLGLDRKQMEEERLARMKKRKAQVLDGAKNDEPRQRQKTNEKAGPTLNSTTSKPSMPPKLSGGDRAAAGVPSAQTKSTSQSLPFPQGVVKKTWAFGQPRLGDDIKIEEVLQKNQLELAVLSSYQWDDTWLMSKVDLRKTKLILVAFASDEAQKEEMRSNVPGDKIRFCFPRMHGPGAMHSKLQLLKYTDYLRIVVPTGNLVPYDWGESGSMENMVFLIDLPRIEDPEKGAANRLTAFGEDLCYFLSAQGLDEKLIGSLGNYDFSETSRLAFVHTIAGSHQTDDVWRRTGEFDYGCIRDGPRREFDACLQGYCGLGRAVHAVGLGSNAPLQIDFVCSSVGSVSEGLVTALYNACQGDSGLKEYQYRTAKPKAKTMTGKAHSDWEETQNRFRVYFPSHATVAQSKGGVNGAGTICFQSKWWKAPTFPHRILRDCKSSRTGLLMHSKILFVRHTGGDRGGSRAFAYVGSANMSESAWGRLSQDRGTKKPKLTCRNWECGVLVQTAQGCERMPILSSPSPLRTDSNKVTGEDAGDLVMAFKGCVPIPMQVPGTPFPSPSEAKGISVAPWFFTGNV